MKKRDFYKLGRKILTGVVDYKKDYQLQPVIPNQAVTPQQMMDLAKQGIPISSQTAPAAEQGELNPSWDIPADKRKHVDAAELWQIEQDVRKRVKNAHSRDRRLFGDKPKTDE